MSLFHTLSPDDQQRIVRIGTWTGGFGQIERDLLALNVRPEACRQVRDVLVALHQVVVHQVAANVADGTAVVFAA